MTPNRIVIAGAVVWALVVAGGFVHAALHEPGHGGFSELATLLMFLLWQAAALGVAVLVAILRLMAGPAVTGPARWLWIGPLLASGTFALFIAVTFFVVSGP